MSDTIACTLTENALDYLKLAGEQAGHYTPRMLKHALATLADGVELLLKARLEMTDWKLLFDKVEDADEAKYRRGDFKSVYFHVAVERLEQHCHAYLSDKESALIDGLRKMRNKVRHFSITVSKNAVVSVIAQTYKFAIDFITNHLAAEGPADPELLNLSVQFSGFVDKRLAEIGPLRDTSGATVYVDCPTCRQRAMYATGSRAKCLFCNEDMDSEEAADAWADEFFGYRSAKDEYEQPSVEICDECGLQALVNIGNAVDDVPEYLCFACGESGECHRCEDCNRLYFSNGFEDTEDEDDGYRRVSREGAARR
jgi:hypothetical protein